MTRLIFNGEPGESFVNKTQKVLYQFHCNWANTCGLCAQYDKAIGPIWPIPLHRYCRCYQRVVMPGETAEPFVDFREIIDGLDPSQRAEVVGVGNLKLIEAGVVKWEDVVTKSRVRLLREVVAREKVPQAVLDKLKINHPFQLDTLAKIDTPEHVFVAQQRKELVARVEKAGFKRSEVIEALAGKLAERAGVQAVKSIPGESPVRKVAIGQIPALTRMIALTIRPPIPTAPPKPEPKPEPPPPSKPAEPAWEPGTPILVDRPIGERIAASPAAEKTRALADLKGQVSSIARAREIESRLAGLYRDLQAGRITQAKYDAEVPALIAEKRALVKRRGEAEAAMVRAQEITRKAEGTKDTAWSHALDRLPSDAVTKAKEAIEWVRSRLVPSASGDDDSPQLNWKESETGRPYANKSVGVVATDSLNSVDQSVHELGHHVEHWMKGAKEAAFDFLRHRIPAPNRQKLRDAVPGSNYDESEVTLGDDDFGKAFGPRYSYYVGKSYGGHATEVVSMGLEKLYVDPIGFAAKDPEYCTFILGILDGSLRRPK